MLGVRFYCTHRFWYNVSIKFWLEADTVNRHSRPFPNKDLLLALSSAKDVLPNRIEECWLNGLFDEYAEQHFLIRAIENDTKFFKSYFYQNRENFSHGYEQTTFSFTFLMNFNSRLNFLYCSFGKPKIEKFIKDQLSAGKQNYKQNMFFEALSELHLLSHFAAFGPSSTPRMTYEPPMGLNGANPEARFEYNNGITLDIEAKTPNFPERSYEKNIILPGVLMNKSGRIELDNYCKQHQIECRFPRILKLVDFFESAAKKFIIPTSTAHINLLAINWTYADISETELFEPSKLLCNRTNGIFVKKDVALKIGISEEALQKITAVFLYRISEETLLFSDLRYLFKTRSYRIIMNPFVKHSDAKMVHELTHMMIQRPNEVDDNRDIYFNLEFKDWSEEISQIRSIVSAHLL